MVLDWSHEISRLRWRWMYYMFRKPSSTTDGSAPPGVCNPANVASQECLVDLANRRRQVPDCGTAASLVRVNGNSGARYYFPKRRHFKLSPRQRQLKQDVTPDSRCSDNSVCKLAARDGNLRRVSRPPPCRTRKRTSPEWECPRPKRHPPMPF